MRASMRAAGIANVALAAEAAEVVAVSSFAAGEVERVDESGTTIERGNLADDAPALDRRQRKHR